MPFTFNGVGTSLCGARGNIGWGSHDGVEWLVVMYMPVLPLKAVHTFDWNGNQYRAVPISMSFDLIARTFLSRWAWGVGVVGLILGLIGSIEVSKPRVGGMGGSMLILVGLALVFLNIGVIAALMWTDARNKAIRRVLGANTIGNCDPLNLPKSVLRQMAGDARAAHGTPTFADAARSYLQRRAYARAMWAARVCALLENRHEGEQLTDRILADPTVSANMLVVKKNAQRWQALMYPDLDNPEPETPRERSLTATTDIGDGITSTPPSAATDGRVQPG